MLVSEEVAAYLFKIESDFVSKLFEHLKPFFPFWDWIVEYEWNNIETMTKSNNHRRKSVENKREMQSMWFDEDRTHEKKREYKLKWFFGMVGSFVYWFGSMRIMKYLIN